MARLIIEICPAEPRTSACLPDGRDVSDDPTIAGHLADCRASGDVQDACEFVRDRLGVDWRIVAQNAAGEYENRPATAEEKIATARAIYFESDSDFEDESRAETYLIWSAACDLEAYPMANAREDVARRVYAEHGEAWAVVENAGYVGEAVGAVCPSYSAALEARSRAYDADEVEALHVDVAHWDSAGGFWSYDH